MAELSPQERLQPALLDRLIDEEPHKKVEPRENRVLSKAALRRAVLRDLAWLFNATRLEQDAEFVAFPEAEKSVINFGLPALAGETASRSTRSRWNKRSSGQSSISNPASARPPFRSKRRREATSSTVTT